MDAFNYLDADVADLPLDQIAPKIIAFMKNGDSSDGESFEERVNEMLDVWMEKWGSIPNAENVSSKVRTRVTLMLKALVGIFKEKTTMRHSGMAVSSGQRDKVGALLRLGADPDYEESYYQIRGQDGNETLVPAYRFPEEEFRGDGLVEESNFTRRSLHVAVENNDVESLELLLTYGADMNGREKPQDQTALHDAARAKERFDCLKLLVNMGADIDALDFNGHTALYRTLKVVGDSVQLNLRGAEFLVAKDVNLQGRGHLMKVSRIMTTRSVSHETFETLCQFVKLLLDHGVRLDDRTVNDDPLLWYCFAHFEKDALKMVSLLINRGACNPHRHTGENLAYHRINHVIPCGVIRARRSSTEEFLESVDCFDEGRVVMQDAAIVNFILQKLATLINGDKGNLARADAVIDEAAASLELLISSIDTTQSGAVKWCRNDAWSQAWTHADKFKKCASLDAAMVARFEALTSWALKTAETEPTTLKNLARHVIRKLILKKKREMARIEEEERKKIEEEATTKGDKTEAATECDVSISTNAPEPVGNREEIRPRAGEESDDGGIIVSNNGLEWSPRMYAYFEEDVASLTTLPQYLHRYLLFQCR